MNTDNCFQNIIAILLDFWAQNNCAIIQPIDNEVGAGTLHPATSLRSLKEKIWNTAYVQPSRRPKDGRFGKNPNRLQHYYQLQVLMKPSPNNLQQLCLDSFMAIGLDYKKHDIRFVEDDWENPTIGAWGLGWEVWCDGMEILQYTYMQQIGGIELELIPGELTYGLERIATYIQGVDHFKDIKWNYSNDPKNIQTYGDIFLEDEKQYSEFSLNQAHPQQLINLFDEYTIMCTQLVDKKLPLPAYNYCLKACHTFNLLDARGVISVTDRASYMAKVRALARDCCTIFKEMQK